MEPSILLSLRPSLLRNMSIPPAQHLFSPLVLNPQAVQRGGSEGRVVDVRDSEEDEGLLGAGRRGGVRSMAIGEALGAEEGVARFEQQLCGEKGRGGRNKWGL